MCIRRLTLIQPTLPHRGLRSSSRINLVVRLNLQLEERYNYWYVQIRLICSNLEKSHKELGAPQPLSTTHKSPGINIAFRTHLPEISRTGIRPPMCIRRLTLIQPTLPHRGLRSNSRINLVVRLLLQLEGRYNYSLVRIRLICSNLEVMVCTGQSDLEGGLRAKDLEYGGN
ncbi:hypothetical protein CEXT_95091 [Caerostris extrusa]|uniref:Uncharacterized protein n=1 Tax=Caerostris extrusa TaxID=172846 RepID=A0AAV4PHL8_CAEEX|nr:hypothetical protein CEXT_95091 [Caerostris extrusa]